MFALLDLVPRWALAGLLAVFMATSIKLGLDASRAERELATARMEAAEAAAFYDAQRAGAATALAQLGEQYRAQEADLNALAETNRRLTDESIASARAAAAGIRERLRNAAPLPQVSLAGDVPGATRLAAPASYGPDTLGAQLREQAGPLVDEAERADVLRAQLMQCRTLYEAARTP